MFHEFRQDIETILKNRQFNKATPYTLQKFLKSVENHCILIDNMKHNKCNNQMCEKK